MSTTDERIAQWEKMAAEAPDDMAYFSLGNAYKEAERWDDAAKAYGQAIGLNQGMSRAYQFLGESLIKAGRENDAKPMLVKGYKTAAERGDVMPQRSIGEMLKRIGEELPEVEDAAAKKAEVEASGNMVLDRRAGQPQPRLADPPMRGPVGQFIYDHFGQITWNQWIGQGTKVINELRLDFSNVAHQDLYEQHMLEWLQVTREEIDEYAKQQASS
ncbi:Fe(2+)-trafficking protein [Algisphaera agarilytica]|uniref:Fe-S cluster biosynthesis and repair protein YggX n=1 Tax=Algisphaera agarilytica TaxID=1385975 RepID=A0A7X0HAH7_9BACT|nr:Fe(2+)-trafficking protein [Algisphaera agarilytica]MBB6430810.1 Fe-S cluster biosynthesis and repair protein YggX [Algisphaera agarilytica]